jgi:GT2 family glycosyltransferase
MPESPSASIVIPTRGRPEYLDVALASIAPQAERSGAEVIVVSDGPNQKTASVAERHGASHVSIEQPRGANAARNAGIAAARSALIVFVDDDVEAPPGWLDRILDGARAQPGHEVFGGPIRARLEGGGPRMCGREAAPITTLDLGPEDRDAQFVWSANMAVRRGAFERLGAFDERIHGRGEEEDWERRYTTAGGRIRYLAGAGLDHRRERSDATVRSLAGAAYALGRSARRHDARKGTAPPVLAELRTLIGCGWHTVRRRCANGVVMGAQAAGRLREALAPVADPPTDDFLSGTSGQVFGIRATGRALVADAIADARMAVRGEPWRLHRAARAWSRRRVLALGIERAGEPNLLARTREQLLSSKHDVRFVGTEVGNRGKFENLNALLASNPPSGYDWLLVVDDDVALPHRFLDTFLFLAERFQLDLTQPAHRARSHAAWPVTRRQPGSLLRETQYVEIGPVVAFAARTFDTLLPFPELRAGWGLDNHWAAVAREHGWRIGIVDATAIRHGLRRTATAYDREEAIAEGRRFLSDRPYVKTSEAQRTLVTHRSWT